MSEPDTTIPKRSTSRINMRWLIFTSLMLLAALPLVPAQARTTLTIEPDTSNAHPQAAIQVGQTTTFKNSVPVRSFKSAWEETRTAPDYGNYGHTTTLLADGRVLVLGGTSGFSTRDAHVYDPVTGVYRDTAMMGMERSNHTATLLGDGTVLVTGGNYREPGDQSAELYDPALERFTPLSAMQQRHHYHTATLLPNGTVLIVGGSIYSATTPTPEIYDPATKTFTTTGRMIEDRDRHIATLLSDGTVLVVGGDGEHGEGLASAELYDSTTGIWTAIGDMHVGRSGHTATALPDGRVLIAGGTSVTAARSVEIYHPKTRRFVVAGNAQEQRSWHTATLLRNGKVLFAGGWTNSNTLATAELYDPATQTSETVGSMLVARAFHTATLLRDGSVYIVGGDRGGVYSSSPATATERYVPSRRAFERVGAALMRRAFLTATTLQNGKILLAGGYQDRDTQEDRSLPLFPAEIYDPTTGIFQLTSAMSQTRVFHTATLLPNGKVLVTGGVYLPYGYRPYDTAEIYDPRTGIFTPTGKMLVRRSEHTATLLKNGKVLIVGGADEQALSTAELYDPVTGTFTYAGVMSQARMRHTATLLDDGTVLIAGGTTDQGVGLIASAERYDPATGNFLSTGDMNNDRGYHTATLLRDGTVLIAGGFIDNTSTERYDPRLGVFRDAGYMEYEHFMPTATMLPDGDVLVIGDQRNSQIERYDVSSGTWTTSGRTLEPRSQHIATLLPDGSIFIHGGDDRYSRQAERGRLTVTNTFTGALIVPTGWITGPTAVRFSASSATEPIQAGRIDDGAWVPAQPGAKVTTVFTPTVQGTNIPVRLRMRDSGGNAAIVVTGTVDVDTVAPTSAMRALLPASPRTFTLDWSGTDATSGIASYDVEVRQGAAGAWTPLLSRTTMIRTTFTGEYGRLYSFRVRARDRAGNREAWPDTFDTQTRIAAAPSATPVRTATAQPSATPTRTNVPQDTRQFLPTVVR